MRRRFFPSGRKGWLALLLLAVWFAAGCGDNLQFKRPRLLCRGRTNDELVVFDFRDQRVLIADRAFRRRRIFTHADLANVWGMDTNATTIVLANQRILGLSRTPEEKQRMAVAEILFFDYDGVLQKRFTWEGETGPVVDPRSVTLLPDGTCIVGDLRLNRLVHLDAAGRCLRTIASYGFDPGQLFYPNDVDRMRNGDLLVVDAFNSRLQIFGPDGAFRGVPVEKGKTAGNVDLPQFAAPAPDGGWFVTELGTRRISAFGPDFRFRFAMQPNLASGAIAQLFDVAVLASPTEVFVTDARNSRIHVFDGAGQWLRSEEGLKP